MSSVSDPSEPSASAAAPAATVAGAGRALADGSEGGAGVSGAEASPPGARIADAVAVSAIGSRQGPWIWLVGALALAALVACALLWQRLSAIQEQLARQSAESGSVAVEARTLARQSSDLARDNAARQAVLEARLGEVALQRSQLEELMQSLSRSRDENLVVDIESALRLAQQQAQLTGSAEPLLAALRGADQRLGRAAQPRLSPVRRAIARDIERTQSARLADVPGLLVRLDELVRLVDEAPLANAVTSGAASAAAQGRSAAPSPWWEQMLIRLATELRSLVRVSRIEEPEAALLSPEQSFFLRENLKLKLLNARLGLLARQFDAARSDLRSASGVLARYFDASSRKTQAAQQLLQQAQTQMGATELPRIDDTLAALTTAAAGR